MAFDDITGMKLDAGKVIEARTKEIHYVRDMRVYDKIPRAQAVRKGWKVIKTRWVDINKGDEDHPEYRSRLVGREFRFLDPTMPGTFAATPPLEAPGTAARGGLRWPVFAYSIRFQNTGAKAVFVDSCIRKQQYSKVFGFSQTALGEYSKVFRYS